jgi:signal transduction histidine kinase
MDPDTTVWWALDVSGARSVIRQLVAGVRPVNWIDTLLDAVRICDVDENTVRLLGSFGGRQRMIGQPVTACWPPEGWPAVADLIVAAVADFPTGAARSRKITSIAFADAVMNISMDDDGAHPDLVFVSIGGTVIDDRSNWVVRASEEQYRSLIHHLPTALLLVDSRSMISIFEQLRRDGVTAIGPYLDQNPGMAIQSRNIVRVTEANLSAVELFAADSIDHLVGPVDFIFAASPETAKRVITAHFDAHFDGCRSYAEIMKLRTFDGRLLDVELSVTYPTPPERLDITFLSFRDVTERLRTETQLRQLQADFSRAGRIATLGELATSIAHEVNQPLSAIVTNAETSLRWLARDDPNLPKVEQLTTRIAENARRAHEIVQRIRAMAMRHSTERVPIDINKVIQESLLFVRHDVDGRSIELSATLTPAIPHLLGDRVQLQQVMVNLLLNGIHAITQHPGTIGRIDLRTTTDDEGAIVIAVRDNGPGIAQENLGRVFEGFFTTKEDGIGIGLAICHSIIIAHDGTIAVSNHPDGGAQFEIRLPAARLGG